ncbi:AAA family ATPase [Pseudomonas citrulli]|uniref:AAA family ATPase n=1 Tax=Pseudomonas citrulli TaxID=3064347 RepID=A0ABT9BVQ3_9PSED|nr:AAA family ATPase [Pseudomonas sp. K18]MDO7896614.1 AAA family ATPase [Pseudomonas sp. K18]
MIVGLLVRNFKTYQAINYVKLSNGKYFSALVGENGAGKSSVLEALNSFFNGADWNYHHSLTKGYTEREPFICPIFLIKKDILPSLGEYQWFVEKVSELTWSANVSDFNPAHKAHAELFCAHREALTGEGYNSSSYYLIPFGIKKDQKYAIPTVFFSMFETLPAYNSLIKNYISSGGAITLLHQRIVECYKYIYLPADIDFKEYTKIEGKTIQALLGQKLDTIVRGFIKREDVRTINVQLNEFLGSISEKLGIYEYRKPAQKQNLVNQSHLTEKVIEAFFESKVLNRKDGRERTPVSDLSSGEKRQALVDVAKAFLLANAAPTHQQIILAVDEPELSLHVSSCFDQFEKLREIAESKIQVLITTHWYGFMPIISNGVAVYCPKSDQAPLLFDLRCFREEIKKLKTDTKGELPIELELKGINDLVQSIIASITSSDYKWLICEGSADSIYLNHYIKNPKLFVVPVGGSPTVKKIFNYLYLALEDSRDDVRGKVFCLIDTDKKFESFDGKEFLAGIQIRRLKNNEDSCRTELLKTSDNNASPSTVIEDTLNARSFISAIESFKSHEIYGPLIARLSIPLSSENDEWPSSLSLNLNFTDRKAMEQLFETEGFKVKFALRYVELDTLSKKPEWVTAIETFLLPPKPKAVKTVRRVARGSGGN